MAKRPEWGIQLPTPQCEPLPGPGMSPVHSVPRNPMATPPSQDPVITTRGLTQPFLPLPDSSSWKSFTSAGPTPQWVQGNRSKAPSPRMAGGEEGAGREGPQAGASCLRSHLPGNLAPWEAGGMMGTRSLGQVWEQGVTREGGS